MPRAKHHNPTPEPDRWPDPDRPVGFGTEVLTQEPERFKVYWLNIQARFDGDVSAARRWFQQGVDECDAWIAEVEGRGSASKRPK